MSRPTDEAQAVVMAAIVRQAERDLEASSYRRVAGGHNLTIDDDEFDEEDEVDED